MNKVETIAYETLKHGHRLMPDIELRRHIIERLKAREEQRHPWLIGFLDPRRERLLPILYRVPRLRDMSKVRRAITHNGHHLKRGRPQQAVEATLA